MRSTALSFAQLVAKLRYDAKHRLSEAQILQHYNIFLLKLFLINQANIQLV